MDEPEFQSELAQLRREWGGLSVDPGRPGTLRADNDWSMGLVVGMRAKVVAEIINRALQTSDPTPPTELP